MKENIIMYLILAIVFYLIACFINVTFNPLDWGTFTKVVYCLGAIFSIVVLVESD